MAPNNEPKAAAKVKKTIISGVMLRASVVNISPDSNGLGHFAEVSLVMCNFSLQDAEGI